MKKLDFYIIKKHLGAFFFTAMIFTVISIAIDYSEKISKIIEHDLSFWEVMTTRYFVYIPYINGELWPLFALISIIFVSSRLAENNEVISMLASGISFGRYLRPWMLSALFLSILFGIGRHVVIPKSNKIYRFYEAKYYWQKEKEVLNDDIHFFISEDTKVFVDRFNERDTTVRGLYLETFNQDTLTRLIKAEKGKWLESEKKWKLTQVEIRDLTKNKEKLYPKIPEIDTTLRLSPQDFIQYSSQREMMTTPQLKSYIELKEKKGLGANKKNYVELHRRNADPFTLLVLTFIGACIASRKKRGGIGLNLAVGVGLGALYIILSKFSHTFASSADLSPLMGVWLPNILFSIVAIYLYTKAQK